MPKRQEINKRAMLVGFQPVEDEQRSDRLILRGTPIVYDTKTMLYEWDGVKYYEIIERGALDGADVSDVVFYFEHHGRVYARSRNGSLKLTNADDSASVEIELDPNDQGHRELYNDIKAGRVDRMSFCFSIEEESFNNETNTFTVKKIRKLFDVSAVAFAAYDQTDIEARDSFREEQARQLAERAANQRRQTAIAYSLTF